MEVSLLRDLLILLPACFFAGVVDAVSGGGGLITLPVFLLTGLPVHVAYASNKMTCTATCVFTGSFFLKNKTIDLRNTAITTTASMVSGAMAAQVMLRLSAQTLDYLFTIALPIVAVFILFRRGRPSEDGSRVPQGRRAVVLAAVIGLIVGLYDGLVGPGSGTLCILLFTNIMHYSMLTASGNSRLVLLGATGVSSITYLFAGNINWVYTAPAILVSIAGSYVGAKIALKNGSKIIRPMMVVIAVLLLVRMVMDTFF